MSTQDRPGTQAQMPPSMMVIQMMAGLWISQLIYVAAKLKIPDLLKGGPKSSDELAQATGMHPLSLYRVLRALTTVGIFAEETNRRFRMTPLAEPLRSDYPNSVRPMAIMFGEEWHWRSWGKLLDAVKTGESAFHLTWGMGTYKYCAQHPEAAATYDAAMVSVTLQTASAVAQAYDYTPIQKLMDVGGGYGILLAEILKANPHLRGVLYELPHVCEGAKKLLAEQGVLDRCEIVAGNFFDSIPPGCDAYLLKSVIHAETNENVVKILENCRRALGGNGKVLAVEMVLPEGNQPFFGKLFDIEMMTQSDNGRDRTEAEYRVLFEKAGLRLARAISTPSPVSIMEGVPA